MPGLSRFEPPIPPLFSRIVPGNFFEGISSKALTAAAVAEPTVRETEIDSTRSAGFAVAAAEAAQITIPIGLVQRGVIEREMD